MKKLLLAFSLFVLLTPVSILIAAGSFQVVTFNEEVTIATHQPTSIPFQYVYSGDYYSKASVISSYFPDGMKLSDVKYGTNGFDTVSYYGTPTTPGVYNLTLILTDNYGAVLTKNFKLNIVGENKIQFIPGKLSNGYVGKEYYSEIFALYTSVNTPLVGRDGLPEGINLSAKHVKNTSSLIRQGTTTVIISGKPTKAGVYPININLEINEADGFRTKKSEIYYLYISDTESTNEGSTTNVPNTSTIIPINVFENFINEEKSKISIIDPVLSARLKGRIILQVESKGQAWYVNPSNETRYYMANGEEAFKILRDFGVGITNIDLLKITTYPKTAQKYSGKIFIQVQDKGQAYYIDFVGKAHYLKDGNSAFQVMRNLGQGISNSDIRKINIGNIK